MENFHAVEVLPSSVKYYTMLLLDAILLFIPWLEDMDVVIKTISLILAVIIGFYTIKKIRADLEIKKIEKDIKKEELKKLRK